MSDQASEHKASDAPASPPGARPSTERSLVRRLRWPLMIGGPVIVLAVVAWFILTGGRYQSTDDSYVQADRTPVSASVPGRVVEVDVKENQRVEAGQVLFKLDAQTYQNALEDAEAQLAAARLQVSTLRAAYGQQSAAVEGADNTVAYTAKEAERQRELEKVGVISKEQVDQAVHAADAARAQAATVRQQQVGALAALGGSLNGPVDSNPTVMAAKAMVDRARLNLSYTVVVASTSGIVTKVDQMPVGTYINAAQPMFWLVSGQPWVEANFKEDQLKKMHVGQKATIKVDAYPDKEFPAHVASFSPGTGLAFSALPAQNATGNWVKVVQRLPVRIAFDGPPPDMASHAGLSAKVKVDTKSDVQPQSATPGGRRP